MQPIAYPDGALRYSGYATMGEANIGNGNIQGRTTHVRLVTQYNMPSPGTCVAQASVVLPMGLNYALGIYIPPGRTIQRITTYREPMDSNGTFNANWATCDVWNLSSFTAGQTVVGKRCGGTGGSFNDRQFVTFGYSTVVDIVDQAQGVAIGCVDSGTTAPQLTITNPQGCRIEVLY